MAATSSPLQHHPEEAGAGLTALSMNVADRQRARGRSLLGTWSGPAPRPTAAGGPGLDEIAIVYGWMHRLCDEAPTAEALTVDVVRRFHSRGEPRWLHSQDASARLRYLTVQVVVDHRRRGPDPQPTTGRGAAPGLSSSDHNSGDPSAPP